mmetsp:Transcript_121710/g.344955  ORF Transcript_121710/g.344955 Transcript_121710/m.344955 type:complete len:262 (-) Transcript_121710:896-1681(-)
MATFTATYSECHAVRFFMLVLRFSSWPQIRRSLPATGASCRTRPKKSSKCMSSFGAFSSSSSSSSTLNFSERHDPVILPQVDAINSVLNRTFGDDSGFSDSPWRGSAKQSASSGWVASWICGVTGLDAVEFLLHPEVFWTNVDIFDATLNRFGELDTVRIFSFILAITSLQVLHGRLPSMSSSRKVKTRRSFFESSLSVSSSFTRRPKVLLRRGISEATRAILLSLFSRVACDERAVIRSSRMRRDVRPATRAFVVAICTK